jgi:hypothetical protein
LTVPATPAYVSYDGPTTSPLTIPFYFLESSHILAIKVDYYGVETVLDLDTDYTVTGAYNEDGGELTLIVELVDGESLIITLQVPIEQLTNYIRNDVFPAQSTEDALDKLTMICKQIAYLASRSWVIDVTDSLDNYQTNIYGGITLPAPVLDYYLHINAITGYIEWRPISFSALRQQRQLASVLGVITVDCSLGDYYECTLFEDITDVVLINLPPAGSVVEFTIAFTQDGTGGWTYSPPITVTHSGGPVILSPAPGAVSHVGYRVKADGTMQGYPALNFF